MRFQYSLNLYGSDETAVVQNVDGELFHLCTMDGLSSKIPRMFERTSENIEIKCRRVFYT